MEVKKTIPAIQSQSDVAKVELNGWQRLWILVTALWLAVVILGTQAFFPTKVPSDKAISSLSEESQSKTALPQELAEVKSRIEAVPQRDLPEEFRIPGPSSSARFRSGDSMAAPSRL